MSGPNAEGLPYQPAAAVRARLVEATRRRRDEEPALYAEWEAAIRAALSAGVGATEVARLAGVDRRRVYQIRDGKR